MSTCSLKLSTNNNNNNNNEPLIHLRHVSWCGSPSTPSVLGPPLDGAEWTPLMEQALVQFVEHESAWKHVRSAPEMRRVLVLTAAELASPNVPHILNTLRTKCPHVVGSSVEHATAANDPNIYFRVQFLTKPERQALMIIEELCDTFDTVEEVEQTLHHAQRIFGELSHLGNTYEIFEQVRKRF